MTKVSNPMLFHAIEHFAFLRKFQHTLYLLTGLPFDFVDTANRSSAALRAQTTFTSFCSLVRATPSGLAACECADGAAVLACAKNGQGIARHCHLGLVDIIVPIVFNGDIAGYFCTGQFFDAPPTAQQFRRIRKRLMNFGMNLTAARRAYFQAPVFDKKRVNAILDLVGMVTGLIDVNRLPLLASGLTHQPLSKALYHIERHFQEPLTLTSTAQAAGLSASRLAHVFKAQLDTSFTAYLNMTRINAAKRQLTDSTLRISEIAFQTGFGNLSHFNHIFRNITGLSPTQYRRQ